MVQLSTTEWLVTVGEKYIKTNIWNNSYFAKF